MDALSILGPLRDAALLLGLSSTRVAVAFLLVPLFTQELIPAMVRNAIFLSIALLALLLQPSPGPLTLSGWGLLPIVAKEAFIGGTLGFFFGSIMWAFEAAGALIDTKAGTTQAQVQDPMSGQTTTLNGALFGRLASFVFMAAGGFMVMVGTLVESYTIWPVRAPFPSLIEGGMRLFEAEFGRIMALTLLVAAPAIVLMYVIEGVLGLINRFAQQLNVFSLSQSLKTVAAIWIVWVQLTSLVQLLQEDLLGRGAIALRTVRALLGS